MEQVFTPELLDALVPAVVGVVGLVVGFAWGKLRAWVKGTPATWDDALLNAVENAVAGEKAKRQAERDTAQ